MGLSRYKLGELIELHSVVNSNLQYGLEAVRGVNNLKQLMSTKADMNGRDISKFQIVYPDDFVFNHRTSRNGSKFSIALNNGQEPIITTEDYVVFKVKDDCKDKLNSVWLYMFFNRSEFDRYVITNSWESSTEFYNWKDICDIDIDLPPIDIQKKYVAIYNSLLENQRSYERGLEDLKLTCDAYIEDLRRNYPCEKIGPYLKEFNERNENQKVKKLQGFCMSGEFIEPRRVSIDLESLKILRSGQLVYNRAVECVSDRFIIALRRDETCAVSSSYIIFSSKDQDVLDNRYLMLWLMRKEFARYSKYKSHGTAHENFEYYDLEEVEIPLPDIKIQKSIAEIYEVLSERKSINNSLKQQIKDICPILIKGSIEEARNG